MAEITGILSGRPAGGQLGNHIQLLPFGFSPLPDGNSRAGHTHQIWHKERVKEENKTKGGHFNFR